MEKLAEERKGPSSMEYKKRQMLAALQTSVQVHAPIAFISAESKALPRQNLNAWRM